MGDQRLEATPPNPDDRVITVAESAQAAAELQAFKALEGRAAKLKRSLRLRIAIAIVIVANLIIGGYSLLKKMAPPPPTVDVVTDVVFRGDFSDFIRATGNLTAYEQVTITPEVDGTIGELHIAEGDTVTAGQLLFTIINPDLDRAIVAAQRGVDNANLSLRSAQNQRNDAAAAVDRTWAEYLAVKTAYDNSLLLTSDDLSLEGAPTEADVHMALEVYRQATGALEGSKISLESVQMMVSDAKTALDQAVEFATKRNVYAPIAGQVVVMNLERGMKLSALAMNGLSAAQIADVSRLRMTVSINELDILNISPGMTGQVHVNALVDYIAQAEVLRVASTSGTNDVYYYGGGGLVTYQVELLIKEPDPRLKIGMSAEAEIITQSLNDVLMVNSMAVLGSGEFSYVVVVDSGGVHREVSVRVIVSNNSYAVIQGGINAGDVVVINNRGIGIGKTGGSSGSGAVYYRD
jgi:HlyD family secretion protein